MKNTYLTKEQEATERSAIQRAINTVNKEQAQKKEKYKNEDNIKAAYANIFGL